MTRSDLIEAIRMLPAAVVFVAGFVAFLALLYAYGEPVAG